MTFFFFLPFLLLFVVFGVWTERKVAGFIQDRYGPMHVGPIGLFQSVADLLKMLQKEDLVPKAADSFIFKLAPLLIFISIFGGYSVLPLSYSISGAHVEPGIIFLLAFIALDVIGILMAGWASNNKYSLYGALRSVSQMVSYEIPLTLSVLCVTVISQSVSLQEISALQGVRSPEPSPLLGLPFLGIDVNEIGGFLSWNIFRYPILIPVFIIFFIASLAEANRAPFDLPESESEIIGGYHTEYAGFRWGIVMLSEYGMMLLAAFLTTILFLGSWNTPFPNLGPLKLAEWTTGTSGSYIEIIWGSFWLISKTLVIALLQMIVRWTYPRMRVDQLMSLGWKYLTPIGLILLFISAVWKLLTI